MFELFKSKPDTGLLCPKCERPLLEHNEGACKRKMSRRFFLGATTGIVIAAALPSAGSRASKFSGTEIVSGKDLIEIEAPPPPPQAWFPGAKFGMWAKGHELFMADFVADGRIMRGTHYGLPLSEEIPELQKHGYQVMVASDFKDLLDMRKQYLTRSAFSFSSLYVPHS